MYRITKMSNKWYAIKVNDIEDDLENINIFIEEGTPVLLCDDLEIVAEVLNVEEEDIILV